jgi:hypothetical protein
MMAIDRVIIQGRDQLDLERGTEMTIIATRARPIAR